MSVAVMAIVAARNSVMQPMIGDHQQHFGREHRIEAADQVHAGGDHRGRVDQRADRRGAFHRVGQPDVQRELRALADAAAEDAQPGDDQQPVAVARCATAAVAISPAASICVGGRRSTISAISSRPRRP